MKKLWNINKVLVDPESGSQKFILSSTEDDCLIEAVMVWFASKQKASICASTQRGCSASCVFCATTYTAPKFGGNMSQAEIFEQITQVICGSKKIWEQAAQRQIVFEGHGEPALNLSAVLNASEKLRLEYDNISIKMVSCCPAGFIESLLEIPEQSFVPELRISLHEVDDAQRAVIMPLTSGTKCKDLLLKARKLAQIRGFTVTVNYMLFKNNCSLQHAKGLVRLLADNHENLKLRLIPLNPVIGCSLETVNEERFDEFFGQVKSMMPESLVVEQHKNYGSDSALAFACGQLRAKCLEGGKP